MALSDSLIAYWKLDEASGNALDAHGSNELTDTNTVGTGTGKINGCRDFVIASNERFTLADNASLSTGNIDFSIAAWVNLRSKGADRAIVSKYDTASNNREYALLFSNTPNRFAFAASTNGTFAGVTQVNADNLGIPALATWYHVVAWHDATNDVIGISVNAGTANTAAYAGGVFDGTSPFNLGALSGLALWDGFIDEVAFWKRVLTSAERTELYNGGSGRDYDYIISGGGGIIQQAMHHYRHNLGA